MSYYAEGDLVRIEKGDVIVQDRLKRGVEGSFFLPTHNGGTFNIDALKRDGWTVTVIEKAAPKIELPTEPGLYRVGGPNAHVEGTLLLDTQARWWWTGNCHAPLTERLTYTDVLERHAPLTRLAPVPDTAKAVLDALKAVSFAGSPRDQECRVIYHDQWDAIAREFGVTE